MRTEVKLMDTLRRSISHQTTKRHMSIQRALEWAFGAEHAQIDFEPNAPEYRRRGLGMEAVLLSRAQLGATVDTSRGRSFPADDAEIIASFVAALPESYGGMAMALTIARHARAYTTPARDACRKIECRFFQVETGGRPRKTVR